MAGSRCIELAGPERVRSLLAGSNVEPVRKRKTREIVEIQVLSFGDDERKKSRHKSSRTLSTDRERYDNPPRVWCLKRVIEFAV